jgi:FkbM family methyltransferase
MARITTDARWAITKARDALTLERQLVSARELTAGDRLRLALSRYMAIARDARQIPYLGQSFHYDGRLMPALMPSYLSEIRRLNAIVPLASATVVDVGANVGQFAATISRQFAGAHIWSFEPNRAISPLLERNAEPAPNWTVIPWGIASRDQEVSLWAVDGKSSQGSVFPDNAVAGLRNAHAVAHSVLLRRLTPERIASLGIPKVVDLLKIDVEGNEASALGGLSDLGWRYLQVEIVTDRTGGLTVDGACDLVESIWQRRPAVVWRDTSGKHPAEGNVVLALS